ncbi:MAG: amidoligase family protein, partial [Pseudomonadales bacterium]|nr:amidoligase family protein [Pseudomonadales bacterium]
AGYEFELGNLTIEEIADALHKSFGGRLEKISAFEVLVLGSKIGKIKVERDTRVLTSLKYREWMSNIGIDFSPGAEGELIEREVDKLSRWIVPCEIVTEPLQFEQFADLLDLVTVLNEHDAQGTQVALHYAFGLHINISVPDLTSQTLLHYLQAFVMLVEWIIQDASTDLTRRFLTNYIDPFPQVYVRKILDPDYKPDESKLIDDYLAYNATRNRALDMLPIFCMLAPEKLDQSVDPDERDLIKGRPAFHYRLPDCRVGKDGWHITQEWNRWQLVEMIASDKTLRYDLMDLWLKEHASIKLIPNAQWSQVVDRFIKDNKLR